MSDKYIPRLSVDITEDQQRRLQKYIPWGLRGPLFAVLVEDMLSLIEEHGEKVIAVLITKKMRPRDLIDMGEKKDGT